MAGTSAAARASAAADHSGYRKVNPSAVRRPGTPDELSTFVRGITKLSAGGGLLCASSPGNPQDGVLAAVQCWGDGAQQVNFQAAEDIAAHPGMVVETLETADQQACVLADVEQDGIRNARCYGTGPVVANLDLSLIANFEGLGMSNEMACTRYQEGSSIVFKCWGDMETDVRETLGQLEPNGCWSSFDVTDGLLCANSGPGPVDECAPVDCWGAPDHPVMTGLAEIADDLVGISSVPGARPTGVHLGVDFACVSYGNSEILCFGNETPSITDHPTGIGFTNLTTSPSGSLACALQPGTVPPADGADPTGTMVCWGEADGVTIELP